MGGPDPVVDEHVLLGRLLAGLEAPAAVAEVEEVGVVGPASGGLGLGRSLRHLRALCPRLALEGPARVSDHLRPPRSGVLDDVGRQRSRIRQRL